MTCECVPGGARKSFQHRHHLFGKVTVDNMVTPHLCVCVCGIETPNGTSEELPGRGKRMTRVIQNVIK